MPSCSRTVFNSHGQQWCKRMTMCVLADLRVCAKVDSLCGQHPPGGRRVWEARPCTLRVDWCGRWVVCSVHQWFAVRPSEFLKFLWSRGGGSRRMPAVGHTCLRAARLSHRASISNAGCSGWHVHRHRRAHKRLHTGPARQIAGCHLRRCTWRFGGRGGRASFGVSSDHH